MELTFVKEKIPKITRAGGSGREAEPWENHLAPLKDSTNESFRVWTYDKRSSAISRMSSVRERLSKAVPHEDWTLAVRLVPGTEKLPGAEQKFGVYVSYSGNFTPEQVVENARKHQERSERVRAARAANKANGNNTAPAQTEAVNAPTQSPTEPTAKEKVAAARAKAGK
jgi:hypothetical protein